jgi:endonuclease YncB( thermonuclease family)
MPSLIIALLLVFIADSAAPAGVIAATHGAGLLIDHDGAKVHIRLANIAAPATGQAHAEQARQSLSQLCVGRAAGFYMGAPDGDGRIAWVVTCDGVNVNREQVKRGLARVNPLRNTDPALPGLEAAARKAELGMWASMNLGRQI